MSMKSDRNDLAALLGFLMVFSFTATVAGQNPRVKTSPQQPATPVEKSSKVSTPKNYDLPTQIPDVIGLTYYDVTSALSKAGILNSKFTYLPNSNSKVCRACAFSISPPAGTVVTRATPVEVAMLARDADKAGKGKLGPRDVERRMGWDLDTGSYEQIYRGADIVLQRIEERHESTTGGSPSFTHSIVFDASDGATLATVDDTRNLGLEVTGPGGFKIYAQCAALVEPPAKTNKRVYVLSLNDPGGERLVCVRTSKGNIGAVYVRARDYLGNDAFKDNADYVFEWALFEREQVKPIQTRPANSVNH